ncbi:haloacid dehalogenase type II [Planococcus sp. ISL-109]|uniref:haloacid dehalogenase type II n=1 Tax=Planococcus sp. ISL-109 TaxID=2819166 RepID=UPI001BEC5D06|nr:haloacid dehalogenase type II [Planococcus sp. ISL-109]MBT2581523.1 haloacid dehalogenase type II [Planococcus sp. ISL-109]
MKHNIKALVFDVYGTLFDVHSVAAKAESLYGRNGAELSQLWRKKQLEYSTLREIMGTYKPFSEVTRDALLHALNELGLPTAEVQQDELMKEYKALTLYGEVPAVLAALGDKRLAVLSNGSRDMLEPLIAGSAINGKMDAIFSVDDIRKYKPSPASYGYAREKLGLDPIEVLFVSSNGWDIAGAKNIGFQTAWVNRSGQADEELGNRPDTVCEDLNGVLEWLKEQ